MSKKVFFAIAIFSLALGVFAAPGDQPQRNRNLLNRGLNRPGQRMPNRPGAGAPAPAANTLAADDDEKKPDTEQRSFKWEQTPTDMILEAYGKEVGKTILIDPGTPKANITLKSQEGRVLTKEDWLEAVEVILEMNGIHLEPYGESFIKALPRKSVRNEGIPLIMDGDEKKLREAGTVVSMMITFKYISAKEEAKEALDQFKSASGILIAFERTNSILVTDTQQNIKRMLEIAHAIDKETPVLEQVFVRQIKYAGAVEVKEFLEKIVEDSMKLMEKSGKGQQNLNQQQRPQPFSPANRLLGRNQPQQQTPVANVSKVMSVSDADRGFIRGNVLILADDRSNKLVIKSLKSNMDFFDKVIQEIDVETTPDTVVKVYRLKYADSEDVSDMINDLIGNAPSGKSSSKGSQNQNSKKGGPGGNLTSGNAGVRKSANQRSGESKTGELSKDNTTVLADKRINGLVVMTEKELVPTIEQIIESMDVKLSQVMIETMIIEVSLGDTLNTGMDWVQKGRQTVQNPVSLGVDKDGESINGFYKQRTTTTTHYNSSGTADGTSSESTSLLDSLVPSTFSSTTSTRTDDESGGGYTITKITESASSMMGTAAQISTEGVANYWTAGTATALAGGQGGKLASEVATGITSNLFGSAFNFIFNSDELGIAGILQMSKTDSHTKYVASPIVLTLDNKEAVIEATAQRQFVTGWTAQSGGSWSGSGMPTPNYTSKDIGIKIKATPKINPNGTVMLEVEEEYTQIGGTQQMMTPTGSGYTETSVDVPSTRKMESDVILENGQTVVFGGLTQTFTTESESGIPLLKDIPWIGKWLFGKVSQSEDRTELLVFMTPYVLTDGESAQAEALRRKKTMSDTRPWEDHGWSSSPLADPVSKKEQMRRIKEEWKKQDAERQTKLEIEKAKLERVKQLEKMTETERKFWLEQHKEELEKEQQEELEKKLQDKDSQEELKKLAEQVKARKSKEAEEAIKKADEESKAENPNEHDRLKLEAEKKLEESKPESEKPETKVEPKSAAEPKAEESNPAGDKKTNGLLGELAAEGKNS